jgi:hypothetical protein
METLAPERVDSVTPSTVFRHDSTADHSIYNADFRDKAWDVVEGPGSRLTTARS